MYIRSSLCFIGLALVSPAIGTPQGTQEATTQLEQQCVFLEPGEALDQIQQDHSEESPIVVAQGELDQLIDCKGGGACPISAALIASQGVRVMAGLPADSHPHRTALRVFQDKPELLLGRISNDRMVILLAHLCVDMEELPVAISTVSAPNSPHAALGPKWSETNGPDLSTAPGELKILAYTVTTADGTVRGRHFVLLKTNKDGRLSFIDPGKPLKKRIFDVAYRGVPSATKRQVFFQVPNGLDKSGQTYELNTIFSVRLLSEESNESRDSNSRVESMKAKIDELSARLRNTDQFLSPVAWRKEGAWFGLPGVDLPASIGGGEYSVTEALELFRHAGRINLNLRDVVGGAHGRSLVKASSSLASDVLGKIVAGEAYIAVSITEPMAGSNPKEMQSKAVRYEGGFKLTGKKLWNARLRQATHVVLYTLAADAEKGEQSVFLIPIDHPGLKVIDRYAHGLTGNSFGGLEFEEMFVSRDHLLGEDGQGGKIFTEHFQYWRLMQAAAAIGCGEAALEQMAERLKSREAFGAPIGRFSHLQQPLGEYHTKLRMAMALAREAAKLIDEGQYEAATPLVNGLKAEGVEIALSACDAAMRAHGAMGYSRDVDLGDRVRDLMGLRIADGTTDVMRMSVVSKAYGSDLWTMSVYGVRSPMRKTQSEPISPVKASPAASND
ncbi:acyl-CoA dehydrogenase family protein [Allorhodopirellula heiligendammensis]|uniref:Glutaryl-CoA dehydrogenase n=1 Tax=Allorhodopirellula heiligendammensis TaxID=2714739 RepID=A0A5C6C2J0_9BACT|nr:acyl-CoA dehydrogenase [Allorhodopirellula heiligendammensis]TWU17871.1 Glutaryl-CoA dehydrogenase [Allorhodopirellula heiligendammensis]